MTAPRKDRHRRLSAGLAALGDSLLAELIGTGYDSVGVGGGARVFEFEGESVFAKRIPLSDRELDRPECTANHFDVPLHCQYGIGAGPSFNVWRELAANRIVTDGVLAGETRAFPMLYHWRVLPGRSPIADEHADIDAVVAAKGGSAEVRAGLEASAAARYSLVLFSEYIPFEIEKSLQDNPIRNAVLVEHQLSEIVTFLRDRRLLHMDAHFGNFRSDGQQIYLTDFGLVTSPRFDLSPTERDFVARHIGYDSDYMAMRLVNWLVTEVCAVRTPDHPGFVARNEYVRCCAAGHIPGDVPQAVAAILTRHAPAAARMNAFIWKLFDGDIYAEYPADTTPPSGNGSGRA
ncbi:serine/threonine protein phosphatase [Nocardia sp. NPDC004722]